MKQYIDFLKANHNLILTGAPGTGKTYLAKQIAEAMNAETAFVQFHPSYDYTDFVEGLRPIQSDDNGDIGFERKDGAFKEFCKRALTDDYFDYEEAYKQLDNDYPEINEAIEQMKKECSNNNIIKAKTVKNAEFTVTYKGKTSFNIRLKSSGNKDSIPIEDIKLAYLGKKRMHNYSYAIGISNYLKKKYNLPDYKKPDNKSNRPFVFIIDEINRGEISKIFGELFFSIDPGYRGEKGMVQTQYQNLVDEDDIFEDGFYIPENVYIIGTMNDIDRSVECMDFAMCRRFAWQEITAEESAENMKLSDEIKDCMTRLNNAISEIEGLNSSYHIGGAYFLKLNNGKINADNLWNNHLRGLLFEYLRGMPDAEEKLNELKNAYDNTNEE